MVEKIPDEYISIGYNAFGFYFWNIEADCLIDPRYRTEKCTRCNYILVDPYIDIIDKLKKAGLLDESYKMLCCSCYRKKEFRKRWSL